MGHKELVNKEARTLILHKHVMIRSTHGLSQEAFAAAIGVSSATVRRWESHDGPAPSGRHIWAICEQFDISPTWWLFDVGPMKLSVSREMEALRKYASAVEFAKQHYFDHKAHINELAEQSERLMALIERMKAI